jgi:serine/threonine protein kinase/tetratricopeptide (TPR) repeat protein
VPTTALDPAEHPDTIVGRALGRYQVFRHLGKGGMATVYLANDPDLRREVAIKVLAKNLIDQPGFTDQLRGEAISLGRLNHAHIAQVYDIFEVDGVVGIVMEYMRGETLGARLRRGALPASEVIRLGRQMAAALAHAHEQGVLHCDFKPANVFITDRGDAKVLDFGLAQTCAGAASAAVAAPALGAARWFGTPAYMSPEQALRAPLDVRSDVYSLGIVIHEMATGRRPTGYTPHADTPAALRPLLTRMLAAPPAARPQSVDEVVGALTVLAEDQRWKKALAAVAALVAATAIVTGVATRWLVPPLAPATKTVLAVPPFATSSAESSTTFLTNGLTEILTNELARDSGIVVVSSASTRSAAKTRRDPSALARELGASHLVLASVAPGSSAGQLRLTLHVFDARTSQSLESGVIEASIGELLGTDRLASAVQARLRAAGIAVQDPDDARSTRYQQPALEDYAQGREILDRAGPPELDGALALFERAVSRDPAFALAHAAIGEVSWRKYRLTKQAMWATRAQEAAFDGLRFAPDEPRVRYTAAVVLHGTGKPKEAIGELTRVLDTQPANDDAHRLLGQIYADLGDMTKAVAEFNAAIALRPGYSQNYRELGVAYFEKGRFEEAIGAFERETRLRPDNASSFQALGASFHALGKVDRALEHYNRAIAIAPTAFAYSNIGLIHYSRRQFREAAAAYEKSAELRPLQASTFRNLGDTYRRLEDAARSRNAYMHAIALTRDELRVNPRDQEALMLQAMCLAKVGRAVEAARVTATANSLAPDDIQVLYDTAVVHAIARRHKEALSYLRRAVAGGYSEAMAAEDDDLEALRTFPEYQEIIRSPQ